MHGCQAVLAPYVTDFKQNLGFICNNLGGPIGAVVDILGPSGPRQSDQEGLIAPGPTHESPGAHFGHIFEQPPNGRETLT